MDRPRRGPSILVKTPVEAFTENEYPPRCVEDGVAAKYDSFVANTKSFPSVEEKRVRVPDPSAFERVAVEPFVPEASDRRPPEGVARTSAMSRASAVRVHISACAVYEPYFRVRYQDGFGTTCGCRSAYCSSGKNRKSVGDGAFGNPDKPWRYLDSGAFSGRTGIFRRPCSGLVLTGIARSCLSRIAKQAG